MKNNKSNKILLKVLSLGIAITVTVTAVNLGENLSKKEIISENKEVRTPVVPLLVNQPTSPNRVENKNKKISTLSINPERTLFVYGEVSVFTEKVAREITALSKKSKEPIVILIDSPGGSVLSGEKVVSAIEASKADVYTVCTGMCASMAAIIHAYGTKRLATDRAILMYHDASAMVGGRVSEMLSILNLIRRKLDKTNHYIANRSKLSYQELITLEANNFWIDSEDAMEKGLVDGLVVVEE